jgi:excisionase family DNA binding protein
MTPARITADNAAMMLGIPLRTVQQMAAAGDLPGAVKVGKRWTFCPAKLRKWLDEGAMQPKPIAKPKPLPRYIPSWRIAETYEKALKSLRKPAKPRLPDDEEPGEPTGFVYVIKAKNRVKIGYAKDVAKRLATLQTASPHRLVVVVHFPGNIEMERRLHARFAKHRSTGEWFTIHQNIRDWLWNNHGIEL